MISVNNLSFRYKNGERIILDGLDASFEKGKFYTIFGSSGSGKSTFLSLLGGMITPLSGSITIDEESVYPQNSDPGKIRRTLVSYVFQNFMLFPYFNAIDNIKMAIEISEGENDDSTPHILSLLEQLGINEPVARRKTKQLSGGEQQRVAVARALAVGSKYILADEPTGNLDQDNAIQLIKLFRDLVHEYDLGLVVVTHSELVRSASDVVYELANGKLVPYVAKELPW